MAQTPKVRRLSREEFKDAPKWIEPLLVWLNQFLDFIILAFNRGITVDDNIQCLVKSFAVQAGATADLNTASFQWALSRAPRLVLVGNVVEQSTGNFVVLTSAVSVFWRYESGTIFITSITGLTSGKNYDVAVIVI